MNESRKSSITMGTFGKRTINTTDSRKTFIGLLAALIWLGLAASSTQGAATDLDITPGTPLSATGFPRGPFSATSQVYTINNTGGSTVSWSVGKDRPWVSLSRNSGSLGGGESTELTVIINSIALDLPVTNDTATLTFLNLGDFTSDTRSVDITLSLPGAGSAAVQSATDTNLIEITLTGGSAGMEYFIEDAPLAGGPYVAVLNATFASDTAVEQFSLATQPDRYFRSYTTNDTVLTMAIARAERIDNSIVRVTGDVNGVYIVEGTTNMVDWVPVSTNKLPASGQIIFTNTVFSPDDMVTYQVIPAGELSLTTLHHILIAGESMAIGLDGAPVLSTTPMESNHRFRSDSGGTSFTRLVETGLETIASGAGNHIVSVAPLQDVLTSNIGQAGAGYELQKKGTALFDLGVKQFQDAPQVVACNLFAYQPRAIFVVGGEGDQLDPGFGSNMGQWQADYESEVQFYTGFTGGIPMFHTQISGWTSPSGGNFDIVTSPFLLQEESEANPTRTILVGPRYFLPHIQEGGGLFPGLHPTSEGYRWLGEYYGKVYKQVVVDGGNWAPVQPVTILRSGTTITAVFNVPAPPLVLDTTLVTDPGNLGFEFHDDSGAPPSITSVSLTGADTVEIELDAVPSGTNERLRYAFTGVPGALGGPTSGPRGNLRDSDATVSLNGNTLYNWCVHFDKPVN